VKWTSWVAAYIASRSDAIRALLERAYEHAWPPSLTDENRASSRLHNRPAANGLPGLVNGAFARSGGAQERRAESFVHYHIVQIT
jgi:hypothetical protein